MEFDPRATSSQAWGGPGKGYDWPKNEHGIYVDAEGNVWVAGNDATDQHDSQVHARGQVPDADRQARQVRRQQQHDAARAARRNMVVDVGRERALRRRRLRQPAASSCSTRRPAPTSGTGARTAARRATSKMPRLRPGGAAVEAVRQRRCTACGCRRTGWSTSATAATTASRCSARTARSCTEFFVEAQTLQNGSTCGPRVLARRRSSATSTSRTGRTAAVHILSRSDGTHARQPSAARPLRRRVPVATQPRRGLEGQSLHRRGGLRAARAEVRPGRLRPAPSRRARAAARA